MKSYGGSWALSTVKNLHLIILNSEPLFLKKTPSRWFAWFLRRRVAEWRGSCSAPRLFVQDRFNDLWSEGLGFQVLGLGLRFKASDLGCRL